MRIILEELLSGVYRLKLGPINVYLVRQPGADLLIDAGLPRHAAAIARHLAGLGLSPSNLRALLLTHRHLDHAGGAAGLRDLGLPEVIVHRADAPAVEGRAPLSPARGRWRWLTPLLQISDRHVFGYRPVTVRAVEGELRLGGLELLPLPGHTPGHCGYYLAERRVVFAGDAAMNLRGQLRHPSAPFSLDPEAVRRSQLRLAELDAEIYCFGHGRPLERGAAALRALALRSSP